MIEVLHESMLLGIVLGLFSGLIPGVGNFVLMILILPFLSAFGVTELLVFYASMATISQYIGSIPATLYGIPGESSSYPAVVESKNLTTTQHVEHAISGSAFGSFFGSMIILLLCYFLADYAELIKYFYSTKILVVLLVVVGIAICFVGNNFWINLILLLVGLGLGTIGYNSHFGISILTFNSMNLYGGLPMEVVLISLFAIPQILQNFSTKQKIINVSYRSTQIYFINPLYTIFYTVVGFIGGLVPGLTTVVSSLAAYNISSIFTKDPVKRIVASETANNAGAFSLMLPLLLFGIPIVGSEAILLSLIEQKGFILSSTNFSDIMTILSINLLIVNAIGLMLALPLSKHVGYFYKLNFEYVFGFLLIALAAVCVYSGYINYSVQYYVIVFAILTPMGILLKNINTLPLVFAFIIHDNLFDGLFRLTQLLG